MRCESLVVVALAAASACSGIEPARDGRPDASVAAIGASLPWVVTEPGYEGEVVVSGLDRPQGVVGLGAGIVFAVQTFGPFGAESEAEVTRVLPRQRVETFATFPSSAAGRESVVDLIRAPGQGFFTSQVYARQIRRVSLSGAIEDVVTTPRGPTFLALDAQGRLYISEVNGDVLRLEPDGSLSTVVDANPGNSFPNRPRGVAFDAAGRMLLLIDENASTAAHKLVLRRFDLAGGGLPLALAAGVVVTDALPLVPGSTPYQDPTIWPVAGDAHVFIVGPNEVYRVSLTDGSAAVFISGLDPGAGNAFNALAVSENGDLLVTEYAVGRITRVRRSPRQARH